MQYDPLELADHVNQSSSLPSHLYTGLCPALDSVITEPKPHQLVRLELVEATLAERDHNAREAR